MKPILSVLLFLMAAVTMVPQDANAAGHPWELRKDKDGIQVHVRKVDGSPILEYKAVTTLDAPLDNAVALYEDQARTTEWFHQCSESRLLESRSDADKVLYMALDMPWPVSNRDAIYLRARSAAEGGGAQFAITALPGAFPEQEGKVRMPYLKGLWRFTPLPDGRTELYVQQHADAGGHIPAAIVNRLVVDIPFNSLKAFRRVLTAEAAS